MPAECLLPALGVAEVLSVQNVDDALAGMALLVTCASLPVLRADAASLKVLAAAVCAPLPPTTSPSALPPCAVLADNAGVGFDGKPFEWTADDNNKVFVSCWQFGWLSTRLPRHAHAPFMPCRATAVLTGSPCPSPLQILVNPDRFALPPPTPGGWALIARVAPGSTPVSPTPG